MISNIQLLGLCCLVCLLVLANGETKSKSSDSNASLGIAPILKKDAGASHVYQIKGQSGKTTKAMAMAAAAAAAATSTSVPVAPTNRKKTKSAHGLNKKLLSKMGFIKVKAPNSHNRKRLAVESRRHATRDDSHMFIIKLPPNLHYYTSHKNAAASPAGANVAAFQSMGTTEASSPPLSSSSSSSLSSSSSSSSSTTSNALKTNGKKVSFPFSSNGRPGRIYHWNLPVLKHALSKKPQFAHVSSADRNRLLDIKDVPTWRKPWENDTVEKSFATSGGKSKYKKSLKPKSPTYYAPAQTVSKQSFHKYFAGNGKPKGFYVIKEKETQPMFYHNIIS